MRDNNGVEESRALVPAPEPAISELETLLRENRPLQAWLGVQQLMRETEHLMHVSGADQALWFGALARGVRSATTCGREQEMVAELDRSLPSWFSSEHWQAHQERITHHFQRLVQMGIRMGRYDHALDVFEAARGLLEPDEGTRQDLARAASKLGRTDLGSARIYLSFLQDDNGDAQLRDEIEARLRQAIRIDLTSPTDDRLAEYRNLNDTLWGFKALVWCAAHRAIAALRDGRRSEAWELRQAALDINEADTDCLILLGTVSYVSRRWVDCRNLFQLAAQRNGGKDGLEQLYLALVTINGMLAGIDLPGSREELQQRLANTVTALEGAPREDGKELDADWVRGSAHTLLKQDKAALDAFATAAPEQISWRHATLRYEAMCRSGDCDGAQRWLEQLIGAEPQRANVAHLLLARQMLERLDIAAAQSHTDAVVAPTDHRTACAADVTTIGHCLRAELAMREARQPEEISLPDEETDVSALARAWQWRLRAVMHLQQGRVAEVAELLEQPEHLVVPQHELQRIEAIRLILCGESADAVDELLEQLATSYSAAPLDRLTWGLWLSARGRHARAREVLTPLTESFPDCLELRLGCAEAELGEGGDVDAARGMLARRDEGHDVGDLAYWTPPRAAVFCPWQREVPAEAWQHSAQLSTLRLADLLYAVDLLIKIPDIERATRVLSLFERTVGDNVGVWSEPLGGRYRRACAAELSQGNHERACQLHGRAVQYNAHAADFADDLAAATRRLDETPTDSVLQVFLEWIGEQRPSQRVEDTLVGAELQRCLQIDDTTPASLLELNRRMQWTERLQTVRPEWDWPKCNLARAAHRTGRHEEVLRWVGEVGEPGPEDHLLQGLAAWELEKYGVAFESFSAAIETGGETPEWCAWRGCARAALRFQQVAADGTPLSAEQVEELLPDLDWKQCDPSSQSRVRVWYAAVLVAAGQGRDAADALDIDTAGTDNATIIRTLRGVAWLIDRRVEDTLTSWGPADQELTPNALERSLRLLVLVDCCGGRERDATVELHRDLRRAKSDDVIYHLASAHLALRDDKVEDARQSLDLAAKAESLPILLAPMRAYVLAEVDFLEARIQMRRGEGREAEERLEQIASRMFWPDAAIYWRAACLIGQNQKASAARLLAELAQRDEQHADARAQLALLAVREGRIDDAEHQVRRSLEVAANHPFATLAQAEIQEHKGDVGAAIDTYRSLIEQDIHTTGARVHAAALMALGRLEIATGRVDDAETRFREATQVCPDWSVAHRRLGFLETAHGKDTESAQDALDRFGPLLRESPEDVTVRIAAALAAQRLDNMKQAAEHLQCALAAPGFSELPPSTRREMVLWGVDLQLALRRFAAAAEALQALIQESGKDAEAVRHLLERGHKCWLLEAISRLKSTPLTQAELAGASAAADAVCRNDPSNALASLLSVLCRVLSGRADDAETRDMAEHLRDLEPETEDQRLLAVTTRYLAGDQEAIEHAQDLLGDSAGNGSVRHGLQLLLANRNGDLETLVQEGLTVVERTEDEIEPSPLSDDDLVLLGTLNYIHSGHEASAVTLLHRWHERGRGNTTSRTVHSQLLAREAARKLTKEDLPAARQLLDDAAALLLADAAALLLADRAERAQPEIAELPTAPDSSGPSTADTEDQSDVENHVAEKDQAGEEDSQEEPVGVD